MVDLDSRDPHTFYFISADLFPKESLNYQALSDKEISFFKYVANDFFKTLFPGNIKESANEIEKLMSSYFNGFVEEVKRLKGWDVSERFQLS